MGRHWRALGRLCGEWVAAMADGAARFGVPPPQFANCGGERERYGWTARHGRKQAHRLVLTAAAYARYNPSAIVGMVAFLSRRHVTHDKVLIRRSEAWESRGYLCG